LLHPPQDAPDLTNPCQNRNTINNQQGWITCRDEIRTYCVQSEGTSGGTDRYTRTFNCINERYNDLSNERPIPCQYRHILGADSPELTRCRTEVIPNYCRDQDSTTTLETCYENYRGYNSTEEPPAHNPPTYTPPEEEASENAPQAQTAQNQQEFRSYNPLFGLILSKNQQLIGNQREVWQGNIKNIKALIELPQGLSLQTETEDLPCDFTKSLALLHHTVEFPSIVDYCAETDRDGGPCTENLYHTTSGFVGENPLNLDGKTKAIPFSCRLNLENEAEFFGVDQTADKPIISKVYYTVEVIETEKISVLEIVTE